MKKELEIIQVDKTHRILVYREFIANEWRWFVEKQEKDMWKLKHIWKYLTSPSYRFWVDFCSLKENQDRAMNEIIENLERRNHPIQVYNPDTLKGRIK